MSSAKIINPRYAPMDHSHIYGFPNPMPCVDWSTHLPMFKGENKDDAGLHKFHIHVCRFRVEFPVTKCQMVSIYSHPSPA